MRQKSLPQRWMKFVITFGLALGVVYGFLPLLNNSFDILHRMALSLDESGINPSRYYYTDVEQVKESENYLRTVLDDK